MKKQVPPKKQAQNKQSEAKLKPTYYLLLFAYLLIPAYTPNFYTLDTNGPKFLAIAILNIISLFVLLNEKDFRQRPELQSGFFRNLIGLAYTLFLLISLVSFTQAYNISESLINLSKLFSVFASAYMLFVIFSSNRRYIMHVALAMVFLLLFDCLTVLYHITQYIGMKVASIYDIKSVYSHKNILTASLFVKIPAALWLIIFYNGWKSKLGYFAFMLASLSVLFMSTRAFYIGIAMLVIALVMFFLIRYIVFKKSLPISKISTILGVFILAFIIFTLVQRFLYPKNEDTRLKFNTGFVERLSTIKADESSTNARLTNWKRSLTLIRQNPLLGVGSGNWKIEVLKYEGPTSDNFIISYKNHNDFLEVTAETGIIGGILYLSIFVLIFFNFLKISLSKKADEEKLKYLFLPTFGILAYSVDAFFNFPNDRPEIQALFAIYIAMAIAFSKKDHQNLIKSASETSIIPIKYQSYIQRIGLLIYTVLIGLSAYFLYLNAISLHYQRLVYEDMTYNKFSHPSNYFIQNFPSIPNLSATGAPISTYISYYFLNENLFEKTVNLLTKDNPTPYDSRREYFLSMAFDKLKNTDSTIYYCKRANELKPLNPNMAFVLSSRLYDAGKQEEAMKTMESFIQKVKNNPEAWLRLAEMYLNTGNENKAFQLLDTATKYLPDDKSLIDNRNNLLKTSSIKPYENLYNQAIQAYTAKRYSEALPLLNEFINKKPDWIESYQNRAVCYYFLGQYAKSLIDIEKALTGNETDKPFLINLRGVNKVNLGKIDEACPDFKLAMDKGDKDGATNYQKFCGQKK